MVKGQIRTGSFGVEGGYLAICWTNFAPEMTPERVTNEREQGGEMCEREKGRRGGVEELKCQILIFIFYLSDLIYILLY